MSIHTKEAGLKVSRDYIYKNLKQEEGKKLYSYKDTKGIWTIGIGHNLQANPTDRVIGRHVYPADGQKITEEECQKLFDYDLDKVLAQLNSHFDFFKYLTGNAQYVMISMTFNMGLGKVAEFRRMIEGLKTDNMDLILLSMKQSKWWNQVKDRAPKLAGIMQNSFSGTPATMPSAVPGRENPATRMIASTGSTIPNTIDSNIDDLTVEERLDRLFGRTSTYI